MSRVLNYVPRVAIFLAGVAAGALTSFRRERGGITSAAAQDLKHSVANLESRLAAQESANTDRFGRIEARLGEHASKLADVPSTSQIVTAMEQLLFRTMSSLDVRLVTQAHSIEVLKTTVSQTDNVLERVLESLDSLQTYTHSADPAGDSLLDRPAPLAEGEEGRPLVKENTHQSGTHPTQSGARYPRGWRVYGKQRIALP